MDHPRFTPIARYLLQIASEGHWKTVAYLDDPEEVSRTIENVPDLRALDMWKGKITSDDRHRGRGSHTIPWRWERVL